MKVLTIVWNDMNELTVIREVERVSFTNDTMIVYPKELEFPTNLIQSYTLTEDEEWEKESYSIASEIVNMTRKDRTLEEILKDWLE